LRHSLPSFFFHYIAGRNSGAAYEVIRSSTKIVHKRQKTNNFAEEEQLQDIAIDVFQATCCRQTAAAAAATAATSTDSSNTNRQQQHSSIQSQF